MPPLDMLADIAFENEVDLDDLNKINDYLEA